MKLSGLIFNCYSLPMAEWLRDNKDINYDSVIKNGEDDTKYVFRYLINSKLEEAINEYLALQKQLK